MRDPYGLLRPSIPVSYLQLLVEIVGERGIAPEPLLAGVPIDPDVLGHATSRMSPMQWTLLVSNAMRLTGEAGLGYEFGLRMRPTVNGFLGYATMSCASVREALDLTLRYVQTRQRQISLRLVDEGDWHVIELRENHPIPALRSFFYECILIGVARGAAMIVGVEFTHFREPEIWVDWPEPAYHARYRDRLPTIRFSRPANRLRFPASLLDLKPVLADPQASRQAIELCERELAQLGGAGDSMGLRVCAELVQVPAGGYPDLETVASRLHLSSRSVARRLRDEGSSFQQLLDEARRRDACDLMERSPLPLADVAARLGYANPSAFTRAFRKWTGASPSRWRELQKAALA